MLAKYGSTWWSSSPTVADKIIKDFELQETGQVFPKAQREDI